MKGVGRELGRMAVGVGEPAELCRDIVGPDEGSFEDGGPVHELGHGSGSRAAWSAPLSVLGDATDHARRESRARPSAGRRREHRRRSR